MKKRRLNLYDRLPEIYKIKDEEQSVPGQLRSYIELFEKAFSIIDDNVNSLYDDHFIDTCREWMIPYIGDLLGNSHLSGDPWTLRADVADTIRLRSRKGTKSAIERLTFNLTKWSVYCVELYKNMTWIQNLNHQRPFSMEDTLPFYDNQNHDSSNLLFDRSIFSILGKGTVNTRDPSILSLLNTPFDPFGHVADSKIPSSEGSVYYNLPNLAIYLWRLKSYQVIGSKPEVTMHDNPDAINDESKFVLQITMHPLGRTVKLFNTIKPNSFSQDNYLTNSDLDILTNIDRIPGPILPIRLSDGYRYSKSSHYSCVTIYDPDTIESNYLLLDEKNNVGIQFHLPMPIFEVSNDEPGTKKWSFRGADLCAWEGGVTPPLKNNEIVIDPIIGRALIGVDTIEKGNALVDNLLISFAYGFSGSVGAHPLPRSLYVYENKNLLEETKESIVIKINLLQNKEFDLKEALESIRGATSPCVIEVNDSMVHELDLGIVDLDDDDNGDEDDDNSFSNTSIRLHNSLIIKSGEYQIPIIKLKHPLRFSPSEEEGFDNQSKIDVRLEGLFLTHADESVDCLISQAALNSLEIINCTLDPGGFKKLDRSISSHKVSIKMDPDYGFVRDSVEERLFNQIPEIVITRSITGSIQVEGAYSINLSDSIIDAGINKFSGSTEEDGGNMSDSEMDGVNNTYFALAGIRSIENSSQGWASKTKSNNVTFFGKVHVEEINGAGNIWTNQLKVRNNQKGCIRLSYFSGQNDQIPQNHGCVIGDNNAVKTHSVHDGGDTGEDDNGDIIDGNPGNDVNGCISDSVGNRAKLQFVSHSFGDPEYGQLSFDTDFRIKERGPSDNQMGAFGFLKEADKWKNIRIRFREFMPVGIRPILRPVT